MQDHSLEDRFYTTGEVAKKLNLTLRTLRFYEQQSLLKPKRTPLGHRQFSKVDLERIEFIKLLQELNLTIEEIRMVMNAVDHANKPAISPGLFDFLVGEIESKKRRLQSLLKKLKKLL